jgi:diguanylate cyclase (GGDEF)-like protein/PAS domain S-box-containing protein
VNGFLRFLRSLGVRTRLIALVVSVAVPFAGYVVWDSQSFADRIAARQKQENLAAARIIAARLDDQASAVGRLLATLSHVVPVDLTARAMNDRLLAAVQADSPELIANIGIWNLTGENAGASDPALRSWPLVRERRFFRDASDGRDLAVETTRTSSGVRDVAIFARAIEQGGRIEGVISASVPMRRLETLLDAKASLPANALIVVATPQGEVLQRSGGLDDALTREVSGATDLHRLTSAGEGTFESAALDGEPRWIGASTSQATSWVVLVGTDEQSATAPAWAQLRRELAVGGVVMLVALLFAAALAGGIARPLRRLAADAIRFAGGERGHRTAIHGSGEIGVLGAALNRMAEEAERRTAEVARSERQLRMIADNMPVLITYVDRDERYRYCNAHGARLLGAQGQVIGRSLREVRGEKAYGEIKPHFDRALAGWPVHFTHVYPTLAGARELAVTYLPDYGAGEVQGVYVLGIDMTDRMRAERALRESEERLRAISDNLPVLIAIVDRSLTYRFCNETYRQWLGIDPDTFVGRSLESVVGAAEFSVDQPFIDRVLAGEAVSYERTGRFGAEERHVLISCIPRRSEADGPVDGFYQLVQDLTERRRLEARLEKMAQYDHLTGLPNRYLLHDRLAQAWHRSQREGTRLALVYLDLDAFKPVNDRHGHAAGDHLLRAIADRLSSTVRQSDTVARVGGDEFVVLIDGFSSLAQVEGLVRRIIALIEMPVEWQAHRVACSASIGVATYPPAVSWEAMMETADAAMYQAKSKGPGTYLVAPTQDSAIEKAARRTPTTE